MRWPFRAVLPVVATSLSLALMLWDVHNQRACVTCDTGLPVWPYQAASLMLKALNAPAVVIATPLFLLPHMQTDIARYPTLLATICLWWWWVGSKVDFGVLGARSYRRPKLTGIVLLSVGVVVLSAGALIVGDVIRHWSRYGPMHPLVLGENVAFFLWSLLLTVGCFFVGLRSIKSRSLWTEARPRRPMLAFGCASVVFIALTTSLIGYARETKVDPDSCVVSPETGCIHGTIADHLGKPLKGLKIEVLPLNRTGESRWQATNRQWTDSKGRYSLNMLQPGAYLVAVHYYDAPDARRPYPKTFYPGMELEDRANSVTVAANSPTMLNQFSLRSLPLATIRVEVMWADGTRPKRSNLLFHNRSYPSQAIIGDVAPEIFDGIGSFTLPEGFIYSAQASVTCDGGPVIETRESQPPHTVEVGGDTTPKALTFTIPGAPCVLWAPK